MGDIPSAEISQPLFLYKKTKWQIFKKKINKNYNTRIPDNSNLSNDEIDSHIEQLETVVRSALHESTPYYKEKCHLEDINKSKKIKYLYSKKHKLQTQIHRIKNFNDQQSKQEKKILNQQLAKIKTNLFNEFKKATNDNWNNLIKSINYKDSANFFPKLNKIFKKNNNKQTINSFEITESEKNFLAEKNIQIDLPISASGKLVIEDTDTLPNIIGTLLEKINTEDKPNKSPLENIVNKKIADLKEEFKNLGT